jgi:hypothetical protein
MSARRPPRSNVWIAIAPPAEPPLPPVTVARLDAGVGRSSEATSGSATGRMPGPSGASTVEQVG